MTQQPRGSGGPDLAGEFQRWLVRSGARGVSRELGGQIRSALGRGDQRDVWETATTTPPEESGDCAWCPVCRAARLLRESGPGFASHVSTAGDVLSSVVQEAMAMVESALASTGRAADQGMGQGPGQDAGPRVPGQGAGQGAGHAPGTGPNGQQTPAEPRGGEDSVWVRALDTDASDAAQAQPPAQPPHETLGGN